MKKQKKMFGMEDIPMAGDYSNLVKKAKKDNKKPLKAVKIPKVAPMKKMRAKKAM